MDHTGTYNLTPAYSLFIYPGSAVDVTAIVTNFTDSPVTLLTYPVDGQYSPQGAFALAAEADERTGVGAWAKLTADSITVPANSEQKVPFRISVPAGTEPGDYAGGLNIQPPPVEGETSMVNGETAVRLDVSEWTGTTTKLSFNTPESLLPDSKLNLQATLTEAPPVHLGNAQANLTSEAGQATAETSIFHISWLVVLITLLALALVSFAVWRVTRFLRRARRAMAQVAQPARDPADLRSRRAHRQGT